MRRFLVILALALSIPSVAPAGTLFLIDGRGWGHGVGMSQYGARGYAEAGWSYQRILAHYYRGTELGILPARQVRVLLLEGRSTVTISSPKPFQVTDAQGTGKRLRPGAQKVVAARLGPRRAPLRFRPGAAPLLVDGKAYRGELIVHRRGGALTVVNRLPLDRYLRGVVPWEMPEDWHPQALRAQAVVARSYALATLKQGTTFDAYADTRSQVYGGVEAEEVSTNRAVGATAGRVLFWNGRVATTFYHSTSGGRTVAVGEAWPGATPVPYLVSVADPYDRISKLHQWGPLRLTPAEIGEKLHAGPVRDLLVERGASGRAAEVTIRERLGARRMPSQDFRRALDLRSTWFNVRVLNLDPPLRRALANNPHELTGFVRGLRRVRLEQQVNGGAWRTVGPIVRRPDGRFTVTVRPRGTTSYRLATASGAGAAVTVRPR